MRRREFLGLVGGAAAYPLAARAQQPNRPVVAVLSPVSAIAFARNLNALRAGFRDLDYTEGRNLSIEIRYAGGAVAQLPSLAAELKPDAIVAGSVPAITATHSLTRTIPVVMAATTGRQPCQARRQCHRILDGKRRRANSKTSGTIKGHSAGDRACRSRHQSH